MASRLLCFLLAGVLGAAVSTHRHEFGDSLTRECHFTLGGRRFNLCPLVEAPARSFEHVRTDTALWTSRISLNGPLEVDEVAEMSQQCPRGTWICMTTTTRHGSESEPIAGNIPSISSSTGLKASAELVDNGSVDIRLHGGSSRGRPKATLLHLVCGPTEVPPHPATDLPEDKSYNTYIWVSPHACSTPISDDLLAPSDFRVLEEDSKDNDDDGDGDHQNLLHPMPISDRPRRSTATILLVTGSAIIALGYLAYAPPAPVRHFFDSHIKPLRFRVGEGRLIRWAQEDMGVLGGNADEEEDTMVNSFDSGAVDDWRSDEQIPLKPSPRQNRRWPNYGSAR